MGAGIAQVAARAGYDVIIDIGALGNAFIVVEAATEDFKIKSEIFRSLDQVTKPGAILASNTSSISITKLGAVTRRPDKVIGMHFMNPVPVMKFTRLHFESGLAAHDQ